MPTISVVIPVWNREEFIGRALESVLRQTYPPHEILVVDDGSTDATAEVVRAYQSQHPCIQYKHQPNSGVAVARNTAINAATGEWVAFLDSDDVWLRDKLQHAVDVIRQANDVEFIHANKRYLFEDGRDDGREPFPSLEMTNREYLFCHWAIKTSTVLIKHDLLQRLGSLFSAHQTTCQDYELFWRSVAEARAIGYAESCDTEITMNRGSQIRSNNGLSLVEDNITAISSATRWIAERGHPRSYIQALNAFQYWQFRTIMLIHMRRGTLFLLLKDWMGCLMALSVRSAFRALLSAFLGAIRKDKNYYTETAESGKAGA
ncbi:MAG TPA: glycosyltransferase [Gammaproteobacteria bacterium]|nr:glycosyltransferase [Gammaproteobacteria bacterium]